MSDVTVYGAKAAFIVLGKSGLVVELKDYDALQARCAELEGAHKAERQDRLRLQDRFIELESEKAQQQEQIDKLLAGYPEGMTPADVEKLREYNAGLAMESHQQQERIAELIDKDALISSVLHYRDTFHDGDDEFDAGGRYAIKMAIKMANEGKFNPAKPAPHPTEKGET